MGIGFRRHREVKRLTRIGKANIYRKMGVDISRRRRSLASDRLLGAVETYDWIATRPVRGARAMT